MGVEINKRSGPGRKKGSVSPLLPEAPAPLRQLRVASCGPRSLLNYRLSGGGGEPRCDVGLISGYSDDHVTAA